MAGRVTHAGSHAGVSRISRPRVHPGTLPMDGPNTSTFTGGSAGGVAESVDSQLRRPRPGTRALALERGRPVQWAAVRRTGRRSAVHQRPPGERAPRRGYPGARRSNELLSSMRSLRAGQPTATASLTLAPGVRRGSPIAVGRTTSLGGGDPRAQLGGDGVPAQRLRETLRHRALPSDKHRRAVCKRVAHELARLSIAIRTRLRHDVGASRISGRSMAPSGRYWARTSDLRLVEAALSQLS